MGGQRGAGGVAAGAVQDGGCGVSRAERIGDEVIGVKEGADVSVHGSFDSIVDGLVLTARIEAPVAAECTRCLKPIKRDWGVDVVAFFPYEESAKARSHGKPKNEDVEIVAGEDESEDVYPLSRDGAFATWRRCCVTRWWRRCHCSPCAARTAGDCARSAASTSTSTRTIIMT